MKINFLKYTAFIIIIIIFIGCSYSIYLIKSFEYKNEESYQHNNAIFESELKKINAKEYVIDKKRVNDLVLLAIDRKYEQEIISILSTLLVVIIGMLCLALTALVLKELRINKLKNQNRFNES